MPDVAKLFVWPSHGGDAEMAVFQRTTAVLPSLVGAKMIVPFQWSLGRPTGPELHPHAEPTTW